MAITYNDLYLDVRRALLREGTSSASLEARELICFVTGKTAEGLMRDMHLYSPRETEERVRELIDRRIAGEPVAYIVGEWEFYGLPLDISRDVIVPRADTEVLAEEAIRLAREVGAGARVLDLCAGSGCVGLAVAAKAEQCRVVLADVSEPALRICRQNMRRNGLNARVTCLQVDALETPPPALWDFDVIVCNPPYIPSGEFEDLDESVREFEPRLALDGGADGMVFYRAIISRWDKALRTGGTLMFEAGIHQADAVRTLMRDAGYANLKVIKDTQGIDRVVCGTVEK